jgi:hypothetical protein
MKRLEMTLTDVVGRTNSLLVTCDLDPDVQLIQHLKDITHTLKTQRQGTGGLGVKR